MIFSLLFPGIISSRNFMKKFDKNKTTWEETQTKEEYKRALFGTGFRIDLLTKISESEIIVKADFDCTHLNENK